MPILSLLAQAAPPPPAPVTVRLEGSRRNARSRPGTISRSRTGAAAEERRSPAAAPLGEGPRPCYYVAAQAAPDRADPEHATSRSAAETPLQNE